MGVEVLQSIESEAGVVSTLLFHPEYIFHSEQLEASHFYDKTNASIYWAVRQLVDAGVTQIDTFNLTNALSSNKGVKNIVESKVDNINEFFELGKYACRNDLDEYKALVKEIQNMALRRDLYTQLQRASAECLDVTDKTFDMQNRVYELVEEVNRKYAQTKDIKVLGDKIDDIWEKIEKRKRGEIKSMAFKIPELKEHVEMDDGELVVVGAHAKVGKSAYLLNEAYDKLKQDKTILVIDSELSDELFTVRLVSHISGVKFKHVKCGGTTDEEVQKIEEAKAWIKTKKFYHEYVPTFSDSEIMSVFKRINTVNKIDLIIIDYFKLSELADAYTVSNAIANSVNIVKNEICGVYKIPAIGAIQTDEQGKVALSKAVVRNLSTLIVITKKTEAEMVSDTRECGNMKMRIPFNRNGAPHSENEYIDVNFVGDTLTFEPCKQHVQVSPY